MIFLAPELSAAAGTTLRQSLLTEIRYDSNARIAPEGQTQADDMVFILVPSFEAVNSRGRTTLSANYSPMGYYYLKNSDINTISHDGTISLDYSHSPRSSFHVSDSITYSEESLDTTLIGLQNERSAIFNNIFTIGASHRLTTKTGVALSLSDTIVDFDAPASTDSRTDSASFSLSYQATPETALTGSYSYSYASFERPSNASSHYETQSIMAGFTSLFRNNLQFSLNGGVVLATSLENQFDWIASTELRKNFQRSSVNFNYARATTSSTGLTDQINLNDRFYAEWNYQFASNKGIKFSGSYTWNHTEPVSLLDTVSVSMGVSGSWRPYDWLSLSTGYTHFEQDSNGPLGEDLTRDHFFINATIATYERRL